MPRYGPIAITQDGLSSRPLVKSTKRKKIFPIAKNQRVNNDNCRYKWKAKIYDGYRYIATMSCIRLLILKFSVQCNMWFNIWQFQKPMNRSRGKFCVSFVRNNRKVNRTRTPGEISMWNMFPRQPVSISGDNSARTFRKKSSLPLRQLPANFRDI